jgi:hypothetical protein
MDAGVTTRKRTPRLLPGSLVSVLLILLAAGRAPAFEPAEVRAILANAPDPEAYPGQPGVILAHQTFRRYEGSGAGILEEHVLARIFEPSEAVGLRTWEVDLDRRLQFAEVLAARIYRGGDTLELGPEDWEEIPVGEPPRAYPLRHRFVIRYPGLQPGDIVEAHVRIHMQRDPTRFPILWGEEILVGRYPVRERQILISVPTAARFQWKVLGWEGRALPTYRGAVTVWDYHTGNLPAWTPGQGTCPTDEGLPRFLYTTASSWESAARIVGREFQWASTTGNVAIEDSVAAVLRGLVGARERLLALLELMDRRVGLAPVPSLTLRYWPQPASDTFDQGWADPADWICLLRNMVRRAGLPHELLLVAPRADRFLPELPTPFQFPYVALKIRLPDEARDVWVDPLRRGGGLDVRPYPGSVVVLNPLSKDAEPVRLDPLEPAQTRWEAEFLLPPGGTTVQGLWRATGAAGAWLRSQSRTPGWELVPTALGWSWHPGLPALPPGARRRPTLVLETWARSRTEVRATWDAKDAASPEGLLSLLPAWLGAGGDSLGICPEGPMEVATRIRFPSALLPEARRGRWEGRGPCASWQLTLEARDGEVVLEERIRWTLDLPCSPRLGDLGKARALALGLSSSP